ncbi:DUF6470 family protein [Natranaerobius trueperi]|uniref:Uncharacterized protein n=1 Tax=Natranaerobius trueperi TaxID=759412 RepID=A0A226C1F2_9FIRM|nr:DUF6470 family protein [Natranaerobius trueperi]OWZ84852.1 hypothetical protein CDO51_00140 [Natranaerobius trueperi]
MINNNLQIDFNFGKLNLNSTPMKSEIDASRRDYQIEEQDSQLSLSKEFSEVEIDYTQTLEDLGYYGLVRVREQSANEGMQTALETIGRIASFGDQLQQIENEGNPLIDQVLQEIWPEKELNLGLVPENPPDINFVEGGVNTDYTPGDVQVDLEDIAKRAYIESGSLNIDVNPKPHIDIRVE